MKLILNYTKPYTGLILFALMLMLFELAVELSLPYFLLKIINEGIIPQQFDVAIRYLVILVVLSALTFIYGILNSYVASHVCHSFSYDLRKSLFGHIQKFSLSQLEQFKTSSIITRLTSDVIACEMVLFMSLRIMLRAPLLVVGSVIMSFVIAPKLAVYLIIATPFLSIFLYFTAKKGMSIFKDVQLELDGLNKNVQQNLSSVRMIKANLSGDFETEKFDHTASKLKEDTTKAMQLMERILPTLLIVMNIALLIMIYMGALDVLKGLLDVGALAAVINYALRMQGGFSMFSFIIMAFSRAKASSDRMGEILDTVPDEIVQSEIKQEEIGGSSISFKDVSFHYPLSEHNVLHHVSFDVAAGEKFVIMGQTGSGKSALLSLVPRMYQASSGQILINNQPIESYPIEKLRQMVGYVPQKNTLFTGSVLENIQFGNAHASIKEVEKATEIAQVYDNIMDFDHQFDTRVGQEGVNLSGGQKQRIAIARAIIKRPSILILDDSTSALDIKTESKLFDALSELSMTRIIVTQKIHTAKTADKILLLDEGRVSAIGTHETLIKTSPLYKAICDSQEEGENIA
ncbi:ABC transporter ATP-binding protein [Macrococcus sp. DPC7161]|uniref:ABC transporter ATP-binding protein n=1 Tax=Macrococcus sp. DPC7161 TaxID=2507060 RepID=UPI00100AACDB|nr:ABC transporter ATP-binding protein [Macrococcus sp. DPC7161]RXK19027.1 ABC transporter ATP-binding protein [Macrococcus sp. DPC7161]